MNYDALRTQLDAIDKTGADGLYVYVACETLELFITWNDFEQMLKDAQWGELNT